MDTLNTQTDSNTMLMNIENNKELQKRLKKVGHYSSEQFLKDALQYIKAIKERRMLCIIISVSTSGMSRNLKYMSCEQSKHEQGIFWYSNYFAFFKALGYSEARNKDGFRVNGCGMDMNFASNYNNIHNLKRLGIITEVECKELAQNTPVCI